MTVHQSLDVGRILDDGRWSGYQKWLVFLTASAVVFDGVDTQLLALAIPALISEWQMPRSAFSAVVSLGYLGMMLGGAAAGLAGDRFGRRTALLGSMVIFSLATLAVAGADSVRSLAALRLLAGIGLGGAMPNAAALAAEYVPRAQRPIAVTLTIVCMPLGGTLAGIVAIAALPEIGWRGLFVVCGAVPLAAAAVLAWLLPESPRYLARHRERGTELAAVLRRMGHAVDREATFEDRSGGTANAGRMADLFAGAIRIDTLLLWAAFFSCLLAVYLGFSWLPTIITGAGLPSSVSSTAISVFNLGGVFGAVAGGALIARFGSKRTMLVMAAVAIAGCAALSSRSIAATSAVLPILALLAISGGAINGVQTTMYALAAHVYPTSMRATGVGTAVSVGRSGAVLSGYAGPWVLEAGGSPAFFGLMAAALSVTFIALAIIRRHVPGATGA